MAFIDQFTTTFEALEWPETFKIYPGRESNWTIVGQGDFTGATFTCEVRLDSSATSYLIAGTVTTSADDGGTILINLDDGDTGDLNLLSNRLWMTLDVTIAGELYPFYAGYVDCEPYGTGLPVAITTIEYADFQAAMDAAVAAAQAAQAAAESAVIGDLSLDALLDVSATPADKHALMGNGTSFETRAIVKADVSDFSEADYATAAQGAKLDTIIVTPPTSGNLLVADGVDFNSVTLSGDATIDSLGEISVIGGQADAVHVHAKVNEVAGITVGDVVYLTGATGGFPQVSLASNTDFSKSDTIALATESASDGQSIQVVTSGLLEGIDTSAFTEGDILYLGVGGAVTATHPSGVDAVQRIGRAVKINASTGSIIVSIDELTVINNHNGTVRHQLVNRSAGTSASAAYTVVNNADRRASLSMVGSGYTAIAGLANNLVLYNEGYGKTVNAVDGNYGFEWWTDVTDTHNLSATSKMALSAAGDLSITGTVDGRDIATDGAKLDLIEAQADVTDEANVVAALDGATLTDAGTPASDDKVLIQDTSAANGLKYASFSEFGGGGVDWTTTQTSATIDGASNVAFNFVADNDFSLGNVLQVGDAGDANLFSVDGDGVGYFKSTIAGATCFVGGREFGTDYNSLIIRQGGREVFYSQSDKIVLGNALTQKVELPSTNLGSGIIETQGGANPDKLTVQVAKRTGDGFAGRDFVLKGGSAFDSATTFIEGGDSYLSGGDGASGSAGLANGGHLFLAGGTGYGTGSAGDLILAAKDSVPATLANSQLSFSLDEVADKLIVTAKYSDGTNKTFEIAANP